MEPCISKDLNKQNASLWKHSAFSKALFRKIKQSRLQIQHFTSVYDQKRQSGSWIFCSQVKAARTQGRNIPSRAGTHPVSRISLQSSNWSVLLSAGPTSLCWGCHDTIQETGPLADPVQADLPHTRARSYQPRRPHRVNATRKCQVHEPARAPNLSATVHATGVSGLASNADHDFNTEGTI